METRHAVSALSALAHEGRLSIFRELVRAGNDGLAAGEIARRRGIPPNTLSASLTLLFHAGLVSSERQGRSIIYRASY
ncbi:metalloregulator ArsR/SmtB family transcription factor, partial [Acinetobacter baumannii]